MGYGCSNLVANRYWLSLAGLLNAIFAKTFDDISIVPTFCPNTVNLFRWCLLFAILITASLAGYI